MQRLDLKASANLVADYFRLFVNRRAYTLQSNRPRPESTRHYYYRPTEKTTGQGLSLTPDTIRRHLKGEITVGLYAINPADQSCKWLAIDADYQDALSDLFNLQSRFEQDGVASAIEQSRRGAHLWTFLAEPLLARDCRLYVCNVALRAGVPVKYGRQREGIEIFPKQDCVKPGRYGNAIRGPLGIHRGAAQRFWFDGADEDVVAQMRYLDSLPKMTREQLARLIAGKTIPPQLAPPEPKPELNVTRHYGAFRILDHISTSLRTVGHNNVTRCPSCAEEGHDTSGDNLSISIENPRKYICWAGCTREMIRAALGYPVSAHVLIVRAIPITSAMSYGTWPECRRSEPT